MLTPLDKIVRDACEEDGDTDYKYYMTFMRYANQAIGALNLFVVPTLTTKKFVIDSTRIIDMSSDFVYYTKVGLMKNGTLVTLSLNEDMMMEDVPLNSCSTKQEADEQLKGLFIGTIRSEYAYRFFGYEIGELYGLQGGFNQYGYYRFDKNNNRFYFTGLDEGDVVFIEYKTNGVGNGAAVIFTEMELSVKSYILWRANFKKAPAIGDRHYRDWKIEYEKLRILYNTFTEREYLDTFWRGIKSTVKR